jgi:hypothetical protein
MNNLKMKYFVLKPKGIDAYAEASRQAMKTYAKWIKKENPELSRDILNWVEVEIESSTENLKL